MTAITRYSSAGSYALGGLLDRGSLHAVVPEEKAMMMSLHELKDEIVRGHGHDEALLALLQNPGWASGKDIRARLVKAVSSHVSVSAVAEPGPRPPPK